MTSLKANRSFVHSSYSYVPVDLSEILPKLMARENLNADQFAYALGVPKRVVAFWLGGGSVTAQKLEDVAFVFGVTPDELFRWAGHSDEYSPPASPQRKQSRLLAAGMVRLMNVRPSTFELSCLLCGRGIGRDGTLRRDKVVPRNVFPCHWCGGPVMAEELLLGQTGKDYYEMIAAIPTAPRKVTIAA